MKCYIHSDKEAMASCTRCGKFICKSCNVELGDKSVCIKCIQDDDNVKNIKVVKGKPKNIILLFVLTFFTPTGFNYLYLGLKIRALLFLKFSVIVYLSNVLYFSEILKHTIYIPWFIFGIIIFYDSLKIRKKIKEGIQIKDETDDIINFCKQYKGLIIATVIGIFIGNIFYANAFTVVNGYLVYNITMRNLAITTEILIALATIFIGIKYINKKDDTTSSNIINQDTTKSEEIKPLEKGELFLLELQEKNYTLAHTSISKEVQEIFNITSKIFEFANRYPHKVRNLNKFIDYYLPTTVKLLNNYEYLNKQGTNGKNIEETSKKIEDMIKNILEAFKNQLDALFEDKALDVDAEVNVLSDILKKEGLM